MKSIEIDFGRLVLCHLVPIDPYRTYQFLSVPIPLSVPSTKMVKRQVPYLSLSLSLSLSLLGTPEILTPMIMDARCHDFFSSVTAHDPVIGLCTKAELGGATRYDFSTK
jgi:hypothetical protein